MKSTALQKSLALQKGLFLIRYEAADDAQQPPKVTFAVDPASSGAVEFLLPPETEKPILWSPGASLIVRAVVPSRLSVEVEARFAGGSVGARIQSTPLSMDPLGMAWADGGYGQVDFSDLRLLGHLAGRGDVYVASSDWLGGPHSPTRIEGIAIEWPSRPQNFGIRHSVRVGGSGEARVTDMVEAGSYSGTRGRALPLVGATFEVFGPASRDHEITAEAIFLGSPQMRVTGQRVVVSGPTGREPLVGLRLQIKGQESAIVEPARISRPLSRPVSRQAAPSVSSGFEPVSPPAAAPPTAMGAVRSGNGRVRVFRSRAPAKTS